jgi:hypothetical protein
MPSTIACFSQIEGRLTAAQFGRARRLGWPSDGTGFRQLVDADSEWWVDF